MFSACHSERKQAVVMEGTLTSQTIPNMSESEKKSEGGTSAQVSLEEQTQAEWQDIYIQIGGAVKHPGVYKTDSSKRVFEVVEMAGGMEPDADADAVNLTSPVTDEMKIYIPRVGEERTECENENQESDSSDLSDDKVNINTADKTQLTTLPGIGPSRAETIIQYREEHGRFQDISEIMNVTGIKQAMFDKIKELITI